MKKCQIFVLSATILALVACNNPVQESTTSNNSNDSSTPLTSETSSNSDGNSSNVETSSSTNTSMTQNQALALFNSALQKNYSNVTIYSTMYESDWADEYNTVQTSETEFMNDGYLLYYSNTLAEAGYSAEDCYSLYYIDDQDRSYLYFESDYSHACAEWQGGYLQQGLSNADLSVWIAYVYLPHILKKLSVDVVRYDAATGYYMVTDQTVIDALNADGFGLVSFDFATVALSIGSNGYFNQIIALADGSTLDNPELYVNVSLSNFGTTVFPSTYTIEQPFAPENVKRYYQMMGWEHDYEDAYYNDATVSLKDEQDKDYTTGAPDGYDAIMNVDDVIDLQYALTPTSFEPWQIEHDAEVEWHWTNGMFNKVNDSLSNGKFRAVNTNGGDGEIWVTFTGAYGEQQTSNKIKIKVNALPDQDKTGAIYDFNWTNIQLNSEGGKDKEFKEITAINEAPNSKALYTITAGMNVSLIDGSNGQLANYFESGRQYLTFSPTANDALNHDRKDDLIFDFGEQQVSKISFKYGFFYENHATNKDKINHVYIETKDDDQWYKEVPVEGSGTKTEPISPDEAKWYVDIADEIKENISTSFMKTYEATFEPTSHVRIDIPLANTVGTPLQICIDSVCFFADENCHNYVAPEDQPVTGINLTPETATVFVGKQQTINAQVLPQGADSTLTWHVEEEKDDIVAVENGKVTGKAPGVAKIWATSDKGEDGQTITSNQVTITVENEPDFTEYVGKKYNDSQVDVTLTFVNSNTIALDGIQSEKITATIESVVKKNNEPYYTMKIADDGGTFHLTVSSSSAFITEYPGSLKTSYSFSVIGEVKSAYLTMSGNRVNEDQIYEVFANDGSTYLTVKPDNSSAPFTVDVQSSDSSVNVSYESSNKTITVQFTQANEEVTLTVTLTDEYNNVTTMTVKFKVKEKVYPTSEADFEIKTDKDVNEIKTGNTVQFSINWLNDKINQNKDEVTWSVQNETEGGDPLATINSKTGKFEAIGEGNVIVTCTVKGEGSTTISKTMTITIQKNDVENPTPGDIWGNYTGWDDYSTYEFTLDIDVNGATLTIVDGTGASYHFTFSKKDGSYYEFTLDDDPTVTLYVNDGGMMFSDDGAYIYDKEDAMFGSSVYFD